MKRAIALAASLSSLSFACDETVTEPDFGPLAVYPGEWNEDDGAAEGRLILEGPCFLLDTGQSKFLLAFGQDGTRWDKANSTARTDHRTLKVGSRVSVGGGGGRSAANVDWVNAPDPECADHPIWFLNNN